MKQRVRKLLLSIPVALAVLLMTAPQSHAFTWLPKICSSFNGCNSKGMGNAGYQNVYTSSHWGTYGGHNCTNYAAYRLIKNGVNASYMTGHGMAYQWGTVARQHGVAVDKSPRVGDIAWFQINQSAGMPYGHVGYVEAVNNISGAVRLSNDNDTGDFAWCDYRISDVTGFIHFGGGNRLPVGSFDLIQTSPGTIRVAGWALDPDSPTTPVTIHAYVGGPAGSGEGHALGAAALSRTDVAAVYPGTGSNHGFDFTFTTSVRGNVPVYLYAIDTMGGNNPLIATKSGTIASPNPYGSLDSVTSMASGTVTVHGWSIDPNLPTSPVTIHVYIGASAGSSGAEGHNIGSASYGRTDVGKVYPGTGNNHGFSVTIKTSKRGSVPVYVYAININGTPESNIELGHSSTYVTTP